MYGLYGRHTEYGADLFVLLDLDNRKFLDEKALQRIIVGTYSSRDFADIHAFNTVVGFSNAVDGERANSLGFEIDAGAKTLVVKGASLVAGVGVFIPSEDWKGGPLDNDKLTGWGYIAATVKVD